jgi:Flp pilus assembly protein TadB
MNPAQNETAGRDVPDAFYRLIEQQTRPPRPSNRAALLACAVFVVVCALLVASLELGADIEQLLLGAFAVAAINLVLALGWMAARRPS